MPIHFAVVTLLLLCAEVGAVRQSPKAASPELREVIRGLQALRGIAQISAVTIAAELGQISRFDTPRQ